MKDKELILKHPELELIDENIWVIHNFVKKNESTVYLNIANSVLEEEWWKENSGWYKGKYLNLSNNEKIKNIANNITIRFSNLFKFGNMYSYGSPQSIHRMLKGQEMFVHADFSEIDNSDEEILLFNTAIYHNEVSGGEIYYPELNIQYKPKRGDLVMHPGTTKYRHGVREVLNETRYISTLWVANDLGMKVKTSGQMYKENK